MRDIILVDLSVHCFSIFNMFEQSNFYERFGKDADPTNYLKCLIAQRLNNPIDFVGYDPSRVEYVYCIDSKVDQPNGTRGYWRHNEFAEYKAGRANRPPEWYRTIELAKEYCAKHNLVVLEHDGQEADDNIAEVCRKFKGVDNVRVFISSVDLDLTQLVGDNVYYAWTFSNKGYAKITRLFNSFHVCAYVKYKFKRDITHPSQIVDIKVELGDKSDNLAPGADRRLIDLCNNHHGIDLGVDPATFVGSPPNYEHAEFARKWIAKRLLPGFPMLTTHGE